MQVLVLLEKNPTNKLKPFFLSYVEHDILYVRTTTFITKYTMPCDT